MTAPIHRWVADPLDRGVRAALGRLAEADDVVHIAVMPDVHLAHDVCIGTVLATTRLLYPAAIGGDVGCGVATIRCGGPAAALDAPGLADAILEDLAVAVPIARHRRPVPLPLDPADLNTPIRRRDAAAQFATLGRGNHFLEVQADPEGGVWILVHTGSRSVGPRIQRSVAPDGGLVAIEADSEAGRAYLADLSWAVSYAELSRQAILVAAARVLHRHLGWTPDPDSYVECAHNLVRREDGRWIHRKGAIEADEGVRGIIPGSMGSPTYHVVGRGCRAALRSASHGAGRRMSRTEARQRISLRSLRRQIAGVRCRDPRVEEAPGAYKDIGAVMRAQGELTRIVRQLRPVINHRG